MEQLPFIIPVTFIVTTVFTVFLLFKASHFSKTVMWLVITWLLLQTAVTLSGFYHVTSGTPPRFALLTVPPFLLIIGLFITVRGRQWMDTMNSETLLLLHVVRIPVELVLYGLYLHHAVPVIMTFEGHNPDILSGLSAPLLWYLHYRKGRAGKWLLLVWNFICLALLANIVVTAVLAAPFRFQQFGFEQPNIALFWFPYSWLPAVVVPVVLLAHVAAIRQLTVHPTPLFAK